MVDGHDTTRPGETDLQSEVEHLRRRIRELETDDSVDHHVHSLFELCPMGIFIYVLEDDDRLVFTAANRAASEILGVDASAFVGRTIEEAFPPLAETEIPGIYRDICRTGRTWSSQQVDYSDEKISGAYEVHAFQTLPRTVAVLFLDVTTRLREAEERDSLRDQLVRSQRMEALGLLASGVAHDLNNVLSGIVSYPELMLDELPEDSPLRGDLEMILDAGETATAIVADLLTIARSGGAEKAALNLNVAVSECLSSPELQRVYERHPGVRVETYLAETSLGTVCSERLVRKSLLNLVVNAVEACSGRGTVRVSTREQYVDEPVAGYDTVQTGEYVVLRVEDDGPAIDPEHLARVFEPFYTKKIMGRKGSGLGLAVVWSTMQDHEGHVDIGSGPGGTWIELFFPASRDTVTHSDLAIEREGIAGGGQRILVVDDEPRQQIIAARMLSRLGYRPEVAGTGERALEMLEHEAYDLVLLDMIMPGGLNGRETYERMVRLRPGQKAVIASGYSLSEDVVRAQALGAGRYLRKPYSLEELGAAIRDELARRH